MASGQRPTPVGWYEPPLYGRTLSITIAFISGCLIAFLLGSYTAVRPFGHGALAAGSPRADHVFTLVQQAKCSR